VGDQVAVAVHERSRLGIEAEPVANQAAAVQILVVQPDVAIRPQLAVLEPKVVSVEERHARLVRRESVCGGHKVLENRLGRGGDDDPGKVVVAHCEALKP
jgi:hypothetical protein